MDAIEAIGGDRPLKADEFMRRARVCAVNPNRNPLKEKLDQADSHHKSPPLLGIFNDIPWHKFRENEAHVWAKAGFSWIVNDGEHCQQEGRYGREQHAIQGRLGLTPIQRLHREARSEHGDALQMGARATMRPYGTTYEDAENYFRSINFPVSGQATPYDRGAYPVRTADRTMTFTPEFLRRAESETQGWLQFETGEYILNTKLRDRILDLMVDQGPNKACGFVGPFDVVLREGEIPRIGQAINELFQVAAQRDVHMGVVISGGPMEDPKDIEDNMVEAMENGVRLIAVHMMTSDLVYRGAAAAADPFFKAAKRCGF